MRISRLGDFPAGDEVLLGAILELRDQGNTVIVIEHNLDVVACADWVIDLGPEGGDKGGLIVAEGAPEAIAAASGTHTGHYLASVLDRAQQTPRAGDASEKSDKSDKKKKASA